PDYLWDDEIGIYTDGENGAVGPCFLTPVNFYQDWDRHADVEYFAIDGKRLFTQSGDLRISGGCSRTFRQKSFALKARNKYGDNEFRYPFFPNKFQAKYGGFFIRNSGNDQSLTMFRDALLQSLIVGQMDIDYQAYQPTALYLNGAYWGIQNLREKVDADYIKTNYGIEEDDIDLLEFNGVAIEGTANAYLSYLEGLKRINVEDSASFDYIAANIDVDEYINYMVTEIYYANTDWPGNNMKFWRQRSNGGKFRWILLDLDFGFDLNKSKPSGALHPTLEFATDPGQTEWPNPAWSTLHFRQVLKNPVFRSKFIERMNAAINVTFQPQRVNKFIDSLQNTIQHEIR
ncbi:MAG: CotH kinase family protein, partial [Imperialibacter sp.]